MDERRKNQRRRTLKNGEVRFSEERSVVACVVRDISPAGAQLLVSTVSGIPSEFKLAIPGEHASDCFVKWRDRFRLGVEFLSR